MPAFPALDGLQHRPHVVLATLRQPLVGRDRLPVEILDYGNLTRPLGECIGQALICEADADAPG